MALLVSGHLWAIRQGSTALKWLLKPTAALTFVFAGVYVGALESTWGTVLFAGLLLAAGGDVFLIPRSTFLAGLVSFLLGHVAYAVAFAVRGVDVAWALGSLLVLGPGGFAIARRLWPDVTPKMQKPVAAYMAVITVMVALAAGTYGARGNVWVVVGAVGFYFSDISVARDRFANAGFANKVWGSPLYFFSQLLLAGTAISPA